jgi:hypothetical protein
VDTVQPSNAGAIKIQGNTAINNSVNGIMFEVSTNGDISHNVVNTNSAGPFYNIYPAQYEILISSSGDVEINNNNVTSRPGAYGSIVYLEATRGDAPASMGQNVNFFQNTVTNTDTASPGVAYGWRILSGSSSGLTICSGTAACGGGNAFYDTSASIIRYMWGNAGPTYTYSSYRSASSQDSASTLTIGSATVSGCTQIGCSGSGW